MGTADTGKPNYFSVRRGNRSNKMGVGVYLRQNAPSSGLCELVALAIWWREREAGGVEWLARGEWRRKRQRIVGSVSLYHAFHSTLGISVNLPKMFVSIRLLTPLGKVLPLSPSDPDKCQILRLQ